MKRYDFAGMPSGYGPVIDCVEMPDGEWVRYEDVAAEIERLQATVDRQVNIIRAIEFAIDNNKMPEQEQTND
ncbi:MAG: hypothetical protein ACE5FH_13275 [Candidatus Zixiibacteriota bacterium]